MMEWGDDFARAYNDRVRAMIEVDLAGGRVSSARAETAPKPKPKREPKPRRVRGVEGEGGYYWDNF